MPDQYAMFQQHRQRMYAIEDFETLALLDRAGEALELARTTHNYYSVFDRAMCAVRVVAAAARQTGDRRGGQARIRKLYGQLARAGRGPEFGAIDSLKAMLDRTDLRASGMLAACERLIEGMGASARVCATCLLVDALAGIEPITARSERLDQAEPFVRVIDDGARSSRALCMLGVGRWRLGQTGAARPLLAKARAVATCATPQNERLDAYRLVLGAWEAIGGHAEADRLWDDLARNPLARARAWRQDEIIALALRWAARGRWPEGRALLAAALRPDELQHIAYELVPSLLAQGCAGPALDVLAMFEADDEGFALQEQAIALAVRGRIAEARAQLAPIEDDDSRPGNLLRLAMAAISQADWLEYDVIAPELAMAYEPGANLLPALAAADQWPRAVALARSLRDDSARAAALRWLAARCARAGDLDQAASLFAEAEQILWSQS